MKLLLIVLIGLSIYGCSPQRSGCPAVRNMSGYGIIEKNVSDEGISVIYMQHRDTFALDFLSKSEYDSLGMALLKQSKLPFIKWENSNTTTIADKKGAIICTLIDYR